MKKSVLSVLFLALLGSLSQISAADADTEKMDFIKQSFQQNKTHSQYWQNGWTGFFAASTVVHAAIWGRTSSHSEAYDAKMTVITSGLGLADTLINPMKSHVYAEKLTKTEVSLPQAEQWLSQAAARERYERSFMSHFLSGAVNGLAAAAIAFDDKRKNDAIMSFVTGMLVSEVKIFTSPTAMNNAWKNYQNGNYRLEKTAKMDAPRWQVAALGPVLALQYQF